MPDNRKPSKIKFKPVVRPPAPKPETEIPDVKYELWQEVRAWARVFVYVSLFYVVLNNFVIVNASVESPSMEYAIRTNDRIVAFRLSYLFCEPQRYDIVVFRREGSSKMYIKRVLGLPGESLLIRDGHVYINGSETPQRHDFVKGGLFGNHGVLNPETGFLEPFVIPEGHFFVLGDWRTNSYDSRRFDEPFVPRGWILGRAVFRYFPGFANLTN